METEFWSIIGVGIGIISSLIAAVAFLYTVIRNFRKDFDEKFINMEKKWEETNVKMDKRITEVNMRMDGVYHILLKRIKEE